MADVAATPLARAMPAHLSWSAAPLRLSDELLAGYLAHLGLTRPAAPTLDALSTLLRTHVETIPFENFDALLGRPVSLAHEAIANKLLSGRRGGYCFEHNLLIAGALVALGFPVALHAGRALVGATAPRPRTHLALLVGLPDGSRRLVDGGFGRTSLRAPLELTPGLEQPLGDDGYRVMVDDGEWTVESRRRDGPWAALYVLDPRPVFPIDIEMANYFVAGHPASLMKERAIVLRPTAAGKRSLSGRRFVVDEGDRQIDRDLDPSELDQVLRDEFGIVLPAPLVDLPH